MWLEALLIGLSVGAPNPISGAIDPLVPVTETSTGKVRNIRIPVGTVTNGFFGGVDASQPYLEWCAFASSINTGSIQASGSTVSCSILLLADGTGRIMEDIVTGQPPHDDGIGKMPEHELLSAIADPNYYIPHRLVYALDPSQFSNALIWPLNGGDAGTGNYSAGLYYRYPEWNRASNRQNARLLSLVRYPDDIMAHTITMALIRAPFS